MRNEHFDSVAENFQMACTLVVYSAGWRAKFSIRVNLDHFSPACWEPFSQWQLLYCTTPCVSGGKFSKAFLLFFHFPLPSPCIFTCLSGKLLYCSQFPKWFAATKSHTTAWKELQRCWSLLIRPEVLLEQWSRPRRHERCRVSNGWGHNLYIAFVSPKHLHPVCDDTSLWPLLVLFFSWRRNIWLKQHQGKRMYVVTQFEGTQSIATGKFGDR